MTHYYVFDNAPKAHAPRSTGALQFHLFSKPREYCVTSCILRSAYSGSTLLGSAFLCDTRRLNSAQSRLRQLYLSLLIAGAIIPARTQPFRNVCIMCAPQYFLRYTLYHAASRERVKRKTQARPGLDVTRVGCNKAYISLNRWTRTFFFML